MVNPDIAMRFNKFENVYNLGTILNTSSALACRVVICKRFCEMLRLSSATLKAVNFEKN